MVSRLTSDDINILAEQFYRQRLHQEAVNRERIYFTKTSKSVNPKQDNPFLFLAGKKPLLVLAPYAVRYKQKKKVMVSHEFTGGMAILAKELSDCHVLAVTKLYGGDPLNDLPCLFKDKVMEICRQHKIKQVITLLAAGRDNNFLLEVQEVGKGEEQSSLLTGKKKWLEEQQNICWQHESAGEVKKEGWLPWFIAQRLNLPSWILKINRKARVPHQNGQVFCQSMAMLISLVEYKK